MRESAETRRVLAELADELAAASARCGQAFVWTAADREVLPARRSERMAGDEWEINVPGVPLICTGPADIARWIHFPPA